MDDKDRLLLAALRRDARRPLVALARDLGLSRSATQARLAKLERSGAIAGYTVVEQAGLQARQSAYLTVRLDPGRRCAEITPRLKTLPAIRAIDSVAGPIDMIVRLEGQDIAELEAARAAVAATPGVAEVSTHIVLERHLG